MAVKRHAHSHGKTHQRHATVLYVADAPFFSGAERALLVTLERAREDLCRPVVVVGHDGELADELRQRQIETLHVPLARTGFGSALAWATSVSRLVAILLRHRPMLIHVNDAPSFQAPGYAARLLAVPIITHVRFPDSRAGFGWLLKPHFDRALFVSEALRSAAVTEAPQLFDHRSEVIYDGVALPDLPDDAARHAIRQRLDLPLDRPVIALTGQIAEVKGIWDFVEAARLLVRQGSRATFAVLGDDLRTGGALRQKMEARVGELGLTDSFRFLGFRPDAPALVPAFDVVAVPSHVEPLGNATLEAMAAGRPVVGSRVGGIPEMVVDGETGWLVPPQNPAGLADRLGHLVANPDAVSAFGTAARARAESVFGLGHHVARLRDAYRHAINPRAHRRTVSSTAH